MIIKGMILIVILRIHDQVKPWQAALIYTVPLALLSLVAADVARVAVGAGIAFLGTWGYFALLRFTGSGPVHYLVMIVGAVLVIMFL